MKIHKDDTVKITAGKDKGKTGKVEKVFPRTKHSAVPGKISKVLVGGVNLYKKHLKSRGEGKPGGIIEITKPIPVANVVLVCPKCQQPTRVGYQLDKQGKKHRFCKKCKQLI